jgi:hypothetical protein
MDKNKKQMVMVGVLLLVMVAVGAFQFMPKSAPAKTDVATTTDGQTTPTVTGINTGAEGTATSDGGDTVAVNDGTKDDPAAAMVQNQLPSRDPFLPTASAQKTAQENAEAGLKTAAPVNQQPAPTYSGPPRTAMGGSFGAPVNPFPDVHPTELGGGLPSVGGGQIGANGAGGIVPAKPSGYKVVGTIVGKQRMAVLEDADGNQILVAEGKKTPDGKARVMAVKKGKAQVRQEGQVKMLGLEEE